MITSVIRSFRLDHHDGSTGARPHAGPGEPGLHPAAIGALEPMVREVIQSYLAPFDGVDAFDAVQDFSGPFPVEIICRMLGVPEGDRQQIRHWLDLMLHRRPGEMDPTPEGLEASMESRQVLPGAGPGTAPSSGRRHDQPAHPGRGRPGGRPDDPTGRRRDRRVPLPARGRRRRDGDQAGGQCRHPVPPQPRPVRQGGGGPGSKIPSAVEEILRFFPPSQYQGRFSVRESVYGGVTVPAGHPTILVTGSATRDERFYRHPDTFDIDRPASLSLGFGYGVHSCLGAALARMESRIAIEELTRRWPHFAVDEDRCSRVQMSNVAGYSSVPVHRSTLSGAGHAATPAGRGGPTGWTTGSSAGGDGSLHGVGHGQPDRRGLPPVGDAVLRHGRRDSGSRGPRPSGRGSAGAG